MNRKEMFVTWSNDDEKKIALKEAYKGYENANSVIIRSKAALGTYRDITSPNVSIKDGFERSDYDYFRQSESLPTEPHDIQKACMQAYDRFGIVRNIIDMMSDFVVKGIDVVHKSPRIQKFGREWFKKVNGKEVSNKIVSLLFKAGVAPVRRVVSKLSEPSLQNLKSVGEETKAKNNLNLKTGEIPTSYTLLNPTSLEVFGGEIALFLGEDKLQYGVKIPQYLLKKLKNPKTAIEVNLVNLIPKDLVKNASLENGLVPIPANRISVLHYKKDDFVLWAKPIIYPILDDLSMLDKLKLADRAALDGAISHVRLWRMGSLEHKIAPTPNAINRLAEMLLNNVGGGCMDLIWGPELDLIETTTETYKFLGNDKYIPTLTSIFQGLGVPPTLTGTSADAGFTNNFISLRILIERLNYCREVLIKFWNNELSVLQSLFGFREEFNLTFDIPSLMDDSSEKKLLIDLMDRNVISEEFVQERFGADSEIEKFRIQRQQRLRKKGILPPKAGPYHIDSTQEKQLERMFVGLGELAPSQVGLEYEKPKNGELIPNESREKIADEYSEVDDDGSNPKKPKGQRGRPKGSGDSVKRKQKNVSPIQNAGGSVEFSRTLIWAMSAQKTIDSIIIPPFLQMKNKKDIRSLSSKDCSELEDLKFKVLSSLTPYQDITEEDIKQIVVAKSSVPSQIKELYLATVGKFIEKKGVNPSIEECRQIQASAYALYKFELE